VLQVLLVKFVFQVVLLLSKARKWPLCCGIDIGTIKSGPSPGFRTRGSKNHKGGTFLNSLQNLMYAAAGGPNMKWGTPYFKW